MEALDSLQAEADHTVNFNEHLAAPFAGIKKGTRQALSLSVSTELPDQAASGACRTWLVGEARLDRLDSYRTNRVQLTLAASCTETL